MARFLAFLAAAVALAAPPRAMRLDYFHTGSAVEERFALDGVTVEGPWPGAPGREIDDTNLGKYCFEVVDRKTNRVLYSRGFASIYGEWETTGEAKQAHRTFHESLRFPGARGRGAGDGEEARPRQRFPGDLVRAGGPERLGP